MADTTNTQGFVLDANSTNVYYKHVEGKGLMLFIRYDSKPFKSKSSDTMLLASAAGGIRLPNGVRVQVNAMMPKKPAEQKGATVVDLSDLLK